MLGIQIDDRVVERATPHQCTLCGTWLPADELVTIARGIRWCGPCAAPNSELVPPPSDVIWPVAGALVGAVVGLVMATSAGAMETPLSLSGLVGSLVGAVVGVGAMVQHAGRL
jgi:hypothetical protein